MRNHRQQGNDSLDLLLDTLCNVFGSIVLIACLLALISREPHPSPVSPVVDVQGAGRLLERRLEKARDELDSLQALRDELKSLGGSSVRKLAAERDELRSTVDRLRAEKQAAAQADGQPPPMTDPGARIPALRDEARAEAERLADITSQLNAAQAQASTAKERLQRLSRQIEESESSRIEQLRMPREKAKAKESRSVILKFGEVFPLEDQEDQPFPGIRRIHEATDGFTAHPKRTEGLFTSRDSEQLKQLFQRFKNKDAYLAIYVYPDSHETFRELKRIIHETGIEYGLESCEEYDIITFSKSGSSPAPL